MSLNEKLAEVPFKAKEAVWELDVEGAWVYVKKGGFMDHDPNRYYCWSGGCGIGGNDCKGFETLEDARDYCLEYADRRISERINEATSLRQRLLASSELVARAILKAKGVS